MFSKRPGESIRLLAADRVENRRHGDRRLQQLGGIDPDFELRLLAALHDDGRYAGHAVQARLEIVGRQLPQPRLRNRVGRQAVAHDRERGEGEPVGGDLRGRRQLRLDARQRGVDALQRLEHVHLPREEQIDLGRPAAGDRPHALESLHAVDRFLDRTRDGHLHLIDRRDAVVDADDDAREVDFGKHRDRNRRRQIDADGDQREDDEDDRLAVARGPVLVAPGVVGRGTHQFLSSSGFVLLAGRLLAWLHDAHLRLVLETDAAVRDDVLARLDAGEDLHHLRLAHADFTGFSCAMFLSSTMRTIVPPSALGRTAGAGMSVAPSRVAATIDDVHRRPARSRSPGLSACTHTCTVVLFAIDAGLTIVTLPVTGSPPSAGVIVASSPTLMSFAWSCAMLTRATTVDMSITVSSGVPAVAISPG